MLHAERGSAQQQSIERIDRHLVLIDSDLTVAKLAIGELQHDVGEMQSHLGELQTTVGELQNTVGKLQNDVGKLNHDVGKLQNTVGKLSDSLGGVQVSVGGLTHEFREFASLARAENATWLLERKRNLRTFDLLQTGLLTTGVETEPDSIGWKNV